MSISSYSPVLIIINASTHCELIICGGNEFHGSMTRCTASDNAPVQIRVWPLKTKQGHCLECLSNGECMGVKLSFV